MIRLFDFILLKQDKLFLCVAAAEHLASILFGLLRTGDLGASQTRNKQAAEVAKVRAVRSSRNHRGTSSYRAKPHEFNLISTLTFPGNRL